MGNVPTHTIRKGQQLYRVIAVAYDAYGQRRYDALEPNPYTGVTFDEGSCIKARYPDNTLVAGRFGPFRVSVDDALAVPTIYFAESAIGAYYEALLRPLGHKQKRILSRENIENKRLARVVLDKDLHLADIRCAYLKEGVQPFWDVSAEALYASSQLVVIKQTRTLAQYIHNEYPKLDGVIWDSVQAQGPVTCMMLFGQRRAGIIEDEMSALSDLTTWRAYLLKGVKREEIMVTPDLINTLAR